MESPCAMPEKFLTLLGGASLPRRVTLRRTPASAVPIMAILKELHILTGHREWVFPSMRQKNEPMGKTSMLAALRAMGITQEEMTPHGFRATARTLLDEVLRERYDLIEQQLAHMVRDPNGRAYNRTVHLAERKRMMSRWATYLDGLREQSGLLVEPAANK